METETSSIANQIESVPVPEPDQNLFENQIHFYYELPNAIDAPAMGTDPQNHMVAESNDDDDDDDDDDLILMTPATIEIKREQQELALELAKNCAPNAVIDMLDDENMFIMKTENDENFAPNYPNAVQPPIRRKLIAKKPPQKPIVERCVGRICAPKKRRINIAANQGSDDGAAGEAHAQTASENETILSDSKDDEIVIQRPNDEDDKPGIVDATDVSDVVAISFENDSINGQLSCEQCKSVHVNLSALRKHYTTKKHTSKVMELAREMARSVLPAIEIQNLAVAKPKDASLYCEECEFVYATKKSMEKHLKSAKHAANQNKKK